MLSWFGIFCVLSSSFWFFFFEFIIFKYLYCFAHNTTRVRFQLIVYIYMLLRLQNIFCLHIVYVCTFYSAPLCFAVIAFDAHRTVRLAKRIPYLEDTFCFGQLLNAWASSHFLNITESHILEYFLIISENEEQK